MLNSLDNSSIFNNKKFIIRAAEKKDIEKIIELWEELMDFHAKRDPFFRRSPDGSKMWYNLLNKRLKDKKAKIIIAELDDDVVGFCHAIISEYPPVLLMKEYGNIIDLAVTEKVRGKGVGEILVKEILTWFKKFNIPRIELTLSAKNEISTKFWTKMGFLPFKEIRAMWLINPEDII